MNLEQPKTLYSTILHNYTYEQLRDLCFTDLFTGVFDCEWDIWRRKAVADFGISEEFFDLVRVLSGPQRYLQIASYVKLSPLSGVRVYEGGSIEGVYEAAKGYKLAEKRGDSNMVFWFFNRLKPEAKEEVKQLGVVLQKIEDKFNEEPEIYVDEEGDDFAHLIEVTEEGNVDVLDSLIHNAFTLPKDFSIARDVPKHHNYNDVTFWKNKVYLLDLPLQELDEDLEDTFLEKLLEASFSSGDTRITDFYLSIFKDKKEEIKKAARRARFGYNSLLRHGNPEDAYGIALRTLRYKKTYDDLAFHMIEVALLHDQTKSTFLVKHMGDITSLMAILPLCSKKDIERALHTLEDELHLCPLSTLLLKQEL
ncbi:Hypothetical protein BRZCDTV_330 [Brazilian cedratvirus IHUMI]|uniref:Uncharacterized protein n=1 Tax=Brazilian cedratvirus IHUMI TaxID=2126980 RepID=A0A2R8FEN4_9VIRU|nr:Hypothetical protein BRZCDTV_330 [Brazilian cedratvirus IHUMI]